MARDQKGDVRSLLFGSVPPKPERPAATPEPLPAETREESPKSDDVGLPIPDPYYKGESRYSRRSGVQMKLSVYLDESVGKAVKMAAASGEDERGRNISAIVNAALREAGYGE